MELKKILSTVDHTLLAQGATWADIKAICDDGMKYATASVCIPASYVKQAKEYVGEKLAICTVIGFPNGYSTTAAKCFEAADAVKNGADEVDMVINIGWAKDQRWDDLLAEISAIKAACDQAVRDRLRFRRGLHQDLHRVRRRRRYPGGRGALCQVCGSPCEDQGCRRHLQPAGCGGFHQSGRFPSGHQPHRQGGEGDRRKRVLMLQSCLQR